MAIWIRRREQAVLESSQGGTLVAAILTGAGFRVRVWAYGET